MTATVTMTTLSWAETAPGVSWPDAHAGSDHDRYSGTDDQWTARVAYRDRTRVSSHVELEAGIRESERSGPDDRRARRSKKPALEDSGYASVPEQEPEIAEPNGPLDHGLPVECSKDPHPGFDSIHATSPTLQPFSSFGTAQPMDAPVAQVGNADIDREVEFLFDEALALIEGGQDTSTYFKYLDIYSYPRLYIPMVSNTLWGAEYLQWGPRGFVPQAKVAKVIAESERLNIDAPSSKIRNAPKFVPYFTAPLYPPVAENHNPDSVMDNVELLFAEAEAFLETGEDTSKWNSYSRASGASSTPALVFAVSNMALLRGHAMGVKAVYAFGQSGQSHRRIGAAQRQCPPDQGQGQGQEQRCRCPGAESPVQDQTGQTREENEAGAQESLGGLHVSQEGLWEVRTQEGQNRTSPGEAQALVREITCQKRGPHNRP